MNTEKQLRAAVNQYHKLLRGCLDTLVRQAGVGRKVVYSTTLSDGGEVSLSQSTAPLFSDARLFFDRHQLTEHCADLVRNLHGLSQRTVVEIGVETGAYSAFLADLFQPQALYLLDITFSKFVSSNSRGCMIRTPGASRDTIPLLADHSVSFAYVDGAHDYASIMQDIELLVPKMVYGGIMQFNDYTSFNLRHVLPYGTRAAVNTLINSQRVRVVGHSLSSLGLDDIAVLVLPPDQKARN